VLFLSPVPTFIRIWKKGSVEQYSPVPYVATLLNCMMWVLYGLPLVHPHSMLVITINGTGMAIELTYVTLFLLYSTGPARRKVVLLLAAEVAFVGAVAVLVLSLAHTHERRSMIVGILCVLFGTGMYAAPLSVMKMVIQTKSVEYMPLSLSLASLVNGICWTAYALIKFDLYITIPNGLGVLFAVAQVVLYAIYYKSTQEIIEARKRKANQVAMTEVVVDDGKTNNNHASAGLY
jgi:solute carrier family 50 protein (sugar transporter)